MFTPLKAITGQEVKRAVIDNSEELSAGQVIIPAGEGVATGGGTTGGLLGIVLGIYGPKGQALEVQSTEAAADNLTVDRVKVDYFPLYIPTEIEAELSADAETTTGSGGHGNFAVDATGLLLNESSYVVFSTTADKQFFSYGTVDGSARTVTCSYMRNSVI